ncbi:hypothetical protein JOD02_000123 [Caldicoprobacter guelmensis]|uniref:hypothetical protein n=1 Tax=Caldicoprobacter guelmensis TaxID=1170224 RepID=UPI00195B853F|nr:hypothetical protein [Caldicoprobacter guelmensis]MBM7581300.1 hypothetical protein [Caldicoprobacter guelmensis]
MGDPQRHAGVDPSSAETQAGGSRYMLLLGLEPASRRRAVCSVARLEWHGWITGQVSAQRGPLCGGYCCMKPMLQKRLEIGCGCRGKPLDCYRVRWGLQCGLSGDPVLPMATR